MGNYRNSHGQTVKITPGTLKCLRKRSADAVKPEVLEVLDRTSKQGLCKNAVVQLENIGLELNVRFDTIMGVMKELCEKGLLNKLDRQYQMLRTIQEDDYM